MDTYLGIQARHVRPGTRLFCASPFQPPGYVVTVTRVTNRLGIRRIFYDTADGSYGEIGGLGGFDALVLVDEIPQPAREKDAQISS